MSEVKNSNTENEILVFLNKSTIESQVINEHYYILVVRSVIYFHNLDDIFLL